MNFSIEVVASFYHENYTVKKNNVVVGSFTPSNGYGSNLHFEMYTGNLTSAEMKNISELLDDLNTQGKP